MQMNMNKRLTFRLLVVFDGGNILMTVRENCRSDLNVADTEMMMQA